MMPNRRQLLAGILGSGLARAVSGYAPTLCAQTYVWTQMLRRRKRTLADGVEDIIAGTAAAGFEHAELMPAFFAEDLRATTIRLLREHELNVPIVYNGGPMHNAAAATNP